MKLIDTHAHLYWDSFKDDFDEIIQRSINAGVTTVINVGVDVEKSKESLRQAQGILAEPFDETQGKLRRSLTVYSTIGIHPHEALRYAQGKLNPLNSIDKDIKELEKIYKSAPEKVIAIGECGLDYFFENNPFPSTLSAEKQKKLQIQLFQAQIDLAKKLKLPLIVHCRDDRSKDPTNSEAWDEVLKMVSNHPTILHCYSGLLPTTNYVLSAPNLIVSFAATLTYPKNEYLRQAVKLLPLEKIVLETDCPFLPPQSKRGQRNEPANILEIAQLIANIKNETLEKVQKHTTSNANRLFALKG